jgi:hypothetical protein
MGRSSFSLIDPPTLMEEDAEMVNKIVKITNIDSIEFNQNNATSNKFNRLCTSADVNSNPYGYSDEHVISSLAVKTLLDKLGIEITGQITETSDKVDELQEWIENHSLPESKIIGPESDIVCSTQLIALEVHNLRQPPTRCRGITSNLMKSPQ